MRRQATYLRCHLSVCEQSKSTLVRSALSDNDIKGCRTLGFVTGGRYSASWPRSTRTRRRASLRSGASEYSPPP
jgi:hypothetical protein